MSHFTRLKTKLVERQHLTAALTDLGYTYQDGEVDIRGYGGNRARVDIKVPTANPGYDIGFAQGKDGYEMVADWWGIADIDRDELIASLTRRYAYHATRASLEREGFGLVSEEAQADGRIHLVLRRVE
jgi:uncharacterized protein DUF1257